MLRRETEPRQDDEVRDRAAITLLVPPSVAFSVLGLRLSAPHTSFTPSVVRHSCRSPHFVGSLHSCLLRRGT